MTALNFVLTPDAVHLVMDTLAMSGDQSGPKGFLSKIYPMPHLDGVVCGTGFQQPITEWCYTVQSSMLVADMVELDQYAPECLPAIFERHRQDTDIPGLTVTLYHFGYSSALERFVGYAYRSENDFASEMFPAEVIAVKPGIPSIPEIKTVPDDLVAVVELQKEHDDSRPVDERVWIGGDIHYFWMEKNPESEDGRPIHMILHRCHRFPDYDDMLIEMRENLARQRSKGNTE